ncbi:MAG: winged helix-turn-helix transcriptional regulator [Chlorobiales bacterium]|jgi:ArsR family transcriptional regulator, arsenate/arsenite/antimonite-responsive transcriptional repressor|nr:winged helix-turn-helix transcriptional regulator [Chlorobiales bacterium]
MGLTKTAVFSERQNKLADFAKAFAHPARVAIIEHLICHKACICGELVDVLPLSQSTISQHLKELKRIGIISGEIDGPKICYSINTEVWKEGVSMLSEIFAAYPLACCKPKK